MRYGHSPDAIAVTLAAVACISICAPGHGAPNWPMWMENPTHTPTPQFEPTAPLTAAWQVHCSGIFGSPVVYEGIVYFGDRRGRLWAVDADSGDGLWVASISERGDEPVEVGRVGARRPRVVLRASGPPVIATPAVDDNCVYVGSLGGQFHGRNRLTGELAWEQDLGAPIASSPVLTEELLVVGTRGGSIVAMDPTDGWVQWTCEVGGEINSSPALADGKVVIGTEDGVIAIAADSGQVLWQQQFQDQTKVDSSPCIVGDRVYAASWRGAVCCLSLGEGQMLWERTVDRYPIFASPTVADGVVYVATTGGLLMALNAETGETVWETEIWRGRTAAYASPVVCGSVVLLGSNARRVHVFDAQTGDRVTDIGMDLASFVHGTPVVTDEGLYVSSEAGPSARSGWVVKFSCQPQRATVTCPQFTTIICWELGLLEGEESEETGEEVGWRVGPRATQSEDQPYYALENLGLITSRHQWARGHLSRHQVAAFYYNLFWDPNPFGVELPEFEPAELLDADRFPNWVRNAPQLVVGLGLMEAPEGRFDGYEGMTASELRSSLRRVKELLGEAAMVQRESVRIVAQAPSPVQPAQGGQPR